VHAGHALVVDAEVRLLITPDLDHVLRDRLGADEGAILIDLKRDGNDEFLSHCFPV